MIYPNSENVTCSAILKISLPPRNINEANMDTIEK